MNWGKRVAGRIIAAVTATLASSWTGAGAADLSRIDNIVVIYAENRSFDHLYGMFPGADGIANAKPEQTLQKDHDGTVLPHLRVWDRHGHVDARFPQLPNAPFRIDAAPVNQKAGEFLPNPNHAFYHHIEQVNGGRNDMFAAMSVVGGYVMGYFDGSQMKLWQWAREYTLADNFFMAAFGGSYLNHQWLICACTPVFADAPEGMRPKFDARGKLVKKPDSPSAKDGQVQLYVGGSGGLVTPDGYSVNTTQPPYQPSGIAPAGEGSLDYANPEGQAGTGLPLPAQKAKTIGDTLSVKGVAWAWYAGGWNAALADGRRPASEKRKVIYVRAADSPNFKPHHQPFNYFERFAPGKPDRAQHLKDGGDFIADIANGKLPSVAFYKPAGVDSQHPDSADLMTGDAHIADVLERLRKSPQWDRMLVIVTYDENGGFWDHVAPPSGEGWGDRWGPATRIPAIIVSPFARRGFVDHTSYDTTSIIKLITKRFDLEPLPGVRAKAGDLTAALQ